MRYQYEFLGKENETLRSELKKLGSKNKDQTPVFKPQSAEEVIQLLENATSNAGIECDEILQAIASVDKLDFIDWKSFPDKEQYGNTPFAFKAIPSKEGESIASPHILISRLIDLELGKGQYNLEIGAGNGYSLAVMANAVGDGRILATEVKPELVRQARRVMNAYGLQDKVEIVQVDELGCQERAPFNRISATGALQRTNQIETLIDQLEEGGILRAPVAKYGNTPDKSEAKTWQPGMNITPKDMYIKDPQRGMARVATMKFKKEGDDVLYSIVAENLICSLLEH